MAKRSTYQEKIIKNYYQNIESISLQKLSEMVTDLYLAGGKKRATMWERITVALEKLKVSASRIEHIRKTDNPALVAKLVTELMETAH